MKEIILAIITVGLIGVFLVFITSSAINHDEINQCNKWQEQSAMYAGFYLVQWQADQCESHHIIINAPVK